jgi:hypothetical protein
MSSSVWPSELLLGIVAQCIVVFNCLISDKYVKLFNFSSNQRAIMFELCYQRCQQTLYVHGKCSGCLLDLSDVASMCIRTVCNIALNNYSKQLSNVHSAAKSRALRKLSTVTN